MNERRTTGDEALPGTLGLEDAPMLTTRLLNKSAMAVTEIRGQPNFGVTKALPYDDAYFISLLLLASPDHDQFFNGRYVIRARSFVACYQRIGLPFWHVADASARLKSAVQFVSHVRLSYEKACCQRA